MSPWNYYALLDFNSIISTAHLGNYTSIEFTLTAMNRHPDNSPQGKRELTDNSEIMVSFAITSPQEEWYYHLYGFKFSGNKNTLNSVSLVYSDMADRTKKVTEKNNYFMKELASGRFTLEYNREYKVKIEFHPDGPALLVDGKPVLKGVLPEKGQDGRIGFSSRNVYVKVRDVRVSNGTSVIFEDRFDRDTLYIRKLKVKRAEKQ